MQAVSEAGYRVLVPQHELDRWKFASRWFDLQYGPHAGNAPTLSIGIDHERPDVSIGDLVRPLLFPHMVLNQFQRAWTDRPISVSFQGNLTGRRRQTLRSWRSQNRVGKIHTLWRRSDGAFVISHSRHGRSWPGKAWDDGYARLLGASKFVLCPDGAFVWTYRFFEAVAAGAIPIIENVSSHYQGFQYFRMSDPLVSLHWSNHVAIENLDRLRDLVTAPSEDLRAAITSTLEG